MTEHHSLDMPVFPLKSGPRKEFLLLPFGELTTIDDSLTLQFTHDDATAVVSAFKERGIKMLVDWEHQSIAHLPGFEAFKSPDGKADAAGWIGGLEIRSDGLWATQVDWTGDAAARISGGAYRYFSPVLLHPNNHVRQVYNVALTNEPRLRNVPALAARSDLLELLNSFQGKDSSMELRDELIQVLGLKAGDSDQVLVTAVKSAMVGTL